MTIKYLIRKAHETACSKGWWGNTPGSRKTHRPPLEVAALIHSEISEFVEEARMVAATRQAELIYGLPGYRIEEGKPEGRLIELADAVIRIADYCGRMGWDLDKALKLKMAYNRTRPHRHGGKAY
jgi:hypothetical protein